VVQVQRERGGRGVVGAGPGLQRTGDLGREVAEQAAGRVGAERVRLPVQHQALEEERGLDGAQPDEGFGWAGGGAADVIAQPGGQGRGEGWHRLPDRSVAFLRPRIVVDLVGLGGFVRQRWRDGLGETAARRHPPVGEGGGVVIDLGESGEIIGP